MHSSFLSGVVSVLFSHPVTLREVFNWVTRCGAVSSLYTMQEVAAPISECVLLSGSYWVVNIHFPLGAMVSYSTRQQPSSSPFLVWFILTQNPFVWRPRIRPILTFYLNKVLTTSWNKKLKMSFSSLYWCKLEGLKNNNEEMGQTHKM